MTKHALITGASRGIGKAAALLFALEGYHVFITCRKSDEELLRVKQKIETRGGTCTAVTGDMGDSADVSRLFDCIHEHCPCLDVLINNAGISHVGLLSDMTDNQWDAVMRTNLSSIFYCCRASIPDMVREKRGRIINLSSMWGAKGASCEVAYSASKAGVDGLTKALAKELAPSGIPVNALACGVIDTGMNAHLSKEEKNALAEEIPAGRFGTVEEAAEMLLHIATAPSYMTGQIIGMDGGF